MAGPFTEKIKIQALVFTIEFVAEDRRLPSDLLDDSRLGEAVEYSDLCIRSAVQIILGIRENRDSGYART